MKNKAIQITKVTINDVKILQKIGKETFSATYSLNTTSKEMADYLEIAFVEQKLVAEIKNPNSEFYFAKINQKVIAYLKVNIGDAQTDFQPENSLEIERIYVLKEFQGKKIGLALLNKAIDLAKEKNTDYIWLGVWQKNPMAIQFYKKHNFVEAGTHPFVFGGMTHNDLLMKLNIKSED